MGFWIAQAVCIIVAVVAFGTSNFNIKTARQSTVFVQIGRAGEISSATCSGVYVGNGLIITARHCAVEPTGTGLFGSGYFPPTNARNLLAVTDLEGRVYSATVLEVADQADFAVLHVDGFKDRAATIACRRPQIGDDVHVVGYPYGVMEAAVSEGTVAAVQMKPDADVSLQLLLYGWPQLVSLTADADPGSSGGPVFDDQGRVVGILVASMGHFSGMIPASQICASFPVHG